LVEPDPEASHVFEIRLIKAGYFEGAFKYRKGIIIKGRKCFEVREGFPCITIGSYKSGVGDIKYSILLSTCKDYEITSLTDEIQFQK
jgi:hypothetical protein